VEFFKNPILTVMRKIKSYAQEDFKESRETAIAVPLNCQKDMTSPGNVTEWGIWLLFCSNVWGLGPLPRVRCIDGL